MHTPTYIHTLHSGTFHLSQNWTVCWFPLCRQSHGILGQSDQINYIFLQIKVLNQSNLNTTQWYHVYCPCIKKILCFRQWCSGGNTTCLCPLQQACYFDYHTHPALQNCDKFITSSKWNLMNLFHNNYICTCSRHCHDNKTSQRHFTYLNLINLVQWNKEMLFKGYHERLCEFMAIRRD